MMNLRYSALEMQGYLKDRNITVPQAKSCLNYELGWNTLEKISREEDLLNHAQSVKQAQILRATDFSMKIFCNLLNI